jgi:hypothetical protein
LSSSSETESMIIDKKNHSNEDDYYEIIGNVTEQNADLEDATENVEELTAESSCSDFINKPRSKKKRNKVSNNLKTYCAIL